MVMLTFLDSKCGYAVFNLDEEKAKKWISTGAQPTDTVKSLLKIAGVL